MSQLQRDLQKRIDEKLQLWVRDSTDLYEMAGLSTRTAWVDMLTTLGTMISFASARGGVDPRDLAEALYKTAASAQTFLRNHERDEDEEESQQ